MYVVAPFRATTAFQRNAASRACRSGSALTSSLVTPVRCAISPACGVSSGGPLEAAATSRTASIAQRVERRRQLRLARLSDARGAKARVARCVLHARGRSARRRRLGERASTGQRIGARCRRPRVSASATTRASGMRPARAAARRWPVARSRACRRRRAAPHRREHGGARHLRAAGDHQHARRALPCRHRRRGRGSGQARSSCASISTVAPMLGHHDLGADRHVGLPR